MPSTRGARLSPDAQRRLRRGATAATAPAAARRRSSAAELAPRLQPDAARRGSATEARRFRADRSAAPTTARDGRPATAGPCRATGSAAVTDRPSSIAPREDRPLRRRRAPPAARDRAGARARPARRRGRPQPRRARARGSPTCGEVVDFTDVDAVIEVARRHAVDGVLTVSADRAVPVVAAVAEGLGLPGIGTETAHLMTHKVAMRRALAEAGVPQPRVRGGPRARRGARGVASGRLPGGAEAGRLRRPARPLPLESPGRPRAPPARGARRVARRRGDRRGVRRGHSS